jgi:hypothetical protein
MAIAYLDDPDGLDVITPRLVQAIEERGEGLDIAKPARAVSRRRNCRCCGKHQKG